MKNTSEFPNNCRIHSGEFGSRNTSKDGAFVVPLSGRSTAQCIVSIAKGWEHVSVTIIDAKSNSTRTPSWAEMTKVKDFFWDKEETTVQFHPKESEYVNNHAHVLHIWKQVGSEYTLPPIELI